MIPAKGNYLRRHEPGHELLGGIPHDGVLSVSENAKWELRRRLPSAQHFALPVLQEVNHSPEGEYPDLVSARADQKGTSSSSVSLGLILRSSPEGVRAHSM